MVSQSFIIISGFLYKNKTKAYFVNHEKVNLSKRWQDFDISNFLFLPFCLW